MSRDGTPITTGYWDRSVEKFANAISEGWNGFVSEIHSKMLQPWEKRLSQGSKILKTDMFEEALGRRYPCETIFKFGWRLVGMDISYTLAKEGQSKLRKMPKRKANFLVTDARHIGLGNETVDAVFSNSTLDHFETKQEIDLSLSEIYRLLKPGGLLLLTLDNPINPIIALRNALSGPIREALKITPYYVGKTYSLKRVVGKLSNIGFEIEHYETAVHVMRFFAINAFRAASAMGSKYLESSLLKICLALEILRKWPISQITGHFICVYAKKPY